jgi:hypothetical protein
MVFPPLTPEYGLTLLAWEEEGTLQSFRRELAWLTEDTEASRLYRLCDRYPSDYAPADLRWLLKFGPLGMAPAPGKLGTALVPAEWELEKLETLVDVEPEPLWLRMIVLSAHLSRRDCPASRSAAWPHALWIIERFPSSPIAAMLSCCFKGDDEAYPQARVLWQSALAQRPGHLGILDSAAHFFFHLDPTLCGDLLRRGKALEPGEPSWSRRLAFLYLKEMRARRDESRKDWAAMSVCEYFVHPESWKSEPIKHCVLPAIAEAAFEADQFERAAELARQLVAEGGDGFAAKNAMHLLGRIALRRGDIAGAEAHLLEPVRGKTPATLRDLPPNMTLARELLEHGEKDAVIEFLRHFPTDQVPVREKVAGWIAQIERGEIPDFDCRRGA